MGVQNKEYPWTFSENFRAVRREFLEKTLLPKPKESGTLK